MMHPPTQTQHVSERSLWYGFSAAAASWAVHGFVSVLISSQACQDGDGDWGGLSAGAVRALLGLITLALLGVAAHAGFTSYKNWRIVSGRSSGFAHADGNGREQFMSLGGIFVSIVFIIGIFWAGLPLVLLSVCVKSR